MNKNGSCGPWRIKPQTLLGLKLRHLKYCPSISLSFSLCLSLSRFFLTTNNKRSHIQTETLSTSGFKCHVNPVQPTNHLARGIFRQFFSILPERSRDDNLIRGKKKLGRPGGLAGSFKKRVGGHPSAPFWRVPWRQLRTFSARKRGWRAPVWPADFQEKPVSRSRKPGKSNSRNNNGELSSRCQVSGHHLLPRKLLLEMDTGWQGYCPAENIIFPSYSLLSISPFSLFSAFPRGCTAFTLLLPLIPPRPRLSTRGEREQTDTGATEG